MRFWDSSALVPLLVDEAWSERARASRDDDPELVVWWAAEIECASAVARRERSGDLDDADGALDRLELLRGRWIEIDPSDRVRRTAHRLVRTHPLRAADALQLAAAIEAAEGDPSTLPFVTLDEVLADAARREGFPVVAF